MTQPTHITLTLLEGNFEFDGEAQAFAQFAEARLAELFPDTESRVKLVLRTSGMTPRPVVSFDSSVTGENLQFLTDGVIETLDRLGDDWANAGCPGIAA